MIDSIFRLENVAVAVLLASLMGSGIAVLAVGMERGFRNQLPGRLFYVLWALVLAILLIRLVVHVRYVHKIVADSSPPWSGHLQTVFQDAQAQVNPGSKVRLRVSQALPVPVVVGLLRPTVLIPSCCEDELSAAQLRLVMLHELIHIRRRDLCVQLLSHFIAIIHWFNPLAHKATARLAQWRELTCDRAVLEIANRIASGQTQLYGKTILQFAERYSKSNEHPVWMPGFIGATSLRRDGRKLNERIVMISEATEKQFSGRTVLGALIGFLIVAFVVATSFTTAQNQAASDDSLSTASEVVVDSLPSTSEFSSPHLGTEFVHEQEQDQNSQSGNTELAGEQNVKSEPKPESKFTTTKMINYDLSLYDGEIDRIANVLKAGSIKQAEGNITFGQLNSQKQLSAMRSALRNNGFKRIPLPGIGSPLDYRSRIELGKGTGHSIGNQGTLKMIWELAARKVRDDRISLEVATSEGHGPTVLPGQVGLPGYSSVHRFSTGLWFSDFD